MNKRRLSAKPSRNLGQARLEQLITALLLSAGSSAMAQSTWSGGTSTDWNTGSNWSAGVPNANTAIINSASGNIATVSASPATSPARVDVGQGASVTGQLDITAGTLTVATPTTGQLAVFVGGGNAASTGTVNVTGSGSLLARNTTLTAHNGRIHIGGDDAGNEGGTGTLNINTTGSVISWDDMFAGSLPTNSTTINNARGTINLDGGSLQGGQSAPGPGGGTIDTNAWTSFGFNNVAVANGTPTVGQVVGTLNQTGGTFSQYGRIYFGRGRNATGNLNLSGGRLETLVGTLNTNIGTTQDNFQMIWGTGGGIANVSITGNSTVVSASHIKVGDGGNGTVVQNSATSSVTTGAGNSSQGALSGEIWIGNGTNPVPNTAAVGLYTLDAGSIAVDSWIAVGRANGNGTLNVNGGSITKTGADTTMLSIGTLGTGTSGTVNQTAGLVDIQTGHVFIAEQAAAGQTATANYTISGGTLQTTGTGTNASVGGTTAASIILGAVNTGNVNASLDLNGGQVRTNRIIGGANVGTSLKDVDFNGTEIVALSNQAEFLGGETLATGGLTSAEVESGGMWINTNGFNVGTKQDFTNGVSSGGLRKTGAGNLTIDALSSSSFTGASKVEAGTLELNGSLGNTPTALWSSTTLAGIGTHNGVVTSTGANISPGITGGTGVGALTFTANVSLDSASVLTVTINDEAPGSLDQVVMSSGTFSAGSPTLSVDFNDTTFTVATGAADLALATQYPIVTGLTSGMFGNASLMSAGDVALLGLSGSQYEAALDGQRFWIKQGSFTLVPLAPVLVPEPAATGLLGGLALLGLTRRRRK